MNTYYVELNFSGNVNLETGIAVSQGDYGNNQFSIATKKDGSFIADAISAEIIFNLTNGYIVTGDLEGSGGLYTYTFKGNELQSPGKTTCMVTLHFKDGRTSSEAFVFDVRYNPLYDRKIDAGPYLTELEKIKNQAQGYVDYLEVLIEQLKQSVGETALTKADLQNDLLQSTPGLKALDAALGSILLTKTDAAEKFASKEDVKGFLTSDIIDNNLLGTDPTHVLASPQGKALADQITQLNSNLAGIIYKGGISNADDAEVNGIYEMGPSTNMGTSGLSANFGIIICFGHPSPNDTSDQKWQWQIAYYVNGFTGGRRTKTNNEPWTEWTPFSG